MNIYLLAKAIKGVGDKKATELSKYFDLSEYRPSFPYYGQIHTLGVLNQSQAAKLHNLIVKITKQ